MILKKMAILIGKHNSNWPQNNYNLNFTDFHLIFWTLNKLTNFHLTRFCTLDWSALCLHDCDESWSDATSKDCSSRQSRSNVTSERDVGGVADVRKFVTRRSRRHRRQLWRLVRRSIKVHFYISHLNVLKILKSAAKMANNKNRLRQS